MGKVQFNKQLINQTYLEPMDESKKDKETIQVLNAIIIEHEKRLKYQENQIEILKKLIIKF